MEELTYQEWEHKYRPIANPFTEKQTAFETSSEELNYVSQQDVLHVWTEVGLDDGVYIVEGYHIENRIRYYITEFPYDPDENHVVMVSNFQDCPNSIDGQCEPDCELCNGDGWIEE